MMCSRHPSLPQALEKGNRSYARTVHANAATAAAASVHERMSLPEASHQRSADRITLQRAEKHLQVH